MLFRVHNQKMVLTVIHAHSCYKIYASGTFKLTLQFTEDYPNKPPTVRFVSRMFHPNSKSIQQQLMFSVHDFIKCMNEGSHAYHPHNYVVDFFLSISLVTIFILFKSFSCFQCFYLLKLLFLLLFPLIRYCISNPLYILIHFFCFSFIYFSQLLGLDNVTQLEPCR